MTGAREGGEACCCCGETSAQGLFSSVDYISGQTFRVVRCRGCGLVRTRPRPRDEDLPAYYPQTHQGAEPAAYERLDAGPRVAFVHALRPAPGRVLDVGCGKGLLLTGLRERGWEVAGTELSEVSSRVARAAGTEVYNLPVEKCPFPPGTFDVVTLFHALEHMTDPVVTLAAVYGLLRPGGLLVVEVPNFGSWYARLFRGAWFHLDVPRHLTHFTGPTLRRILEQTGFEVRRESTRNWRYDAFGAVQSCLNLVLPKNLLNNYETGETTAAKLRQERGVVGVVALAVS